MEITDLITQWTLLEGNLNLHIGNKLLNQDGFLVYEYNPLKVFRKDTGNKKGILSDLRTKYTDDGNKGLNFDLEHPVDILPQVSYDGSVNLILNDGKNSPKIINTRFSVSSSNTYKIVDRDGNNDTNIYDESHFDQSSSLFKVVNKIPKLKFDGLSTDGSLLVGNYNFYFKLSDEDGNETDFIAESGVVSCHIGNLNDPFSIRGGLEDENSFKSVNFTLYNIDSSYTKVVVYYSRHSGDMSATPVTMSYKMLKSFDVIEGLAKINVSGYENVEPISEDVLNILYSLINSAKALTSVKNILFLGNVQKPDIPYKELLDLSLRFLPYLYTSDDIGYVDHLYKDISSSKNPYEYYNAMNIYYRLGYWDEELYRFGVVYILPDGSLSPVFNVRGNINVNKDYKYETLINAYNTRGERDYIDIDKTNHRLTDYENVKGVVRLQYLDNLFDSTKKKVIPLGIQFKISKDSVEELKKYTKGFFFVRQKRLKLTLCLAMSIGLDLKGNFPTLPYNESGYVVERFLDDDKILTHDFNKRMHSVYSSNVQTVLNGAAAICPEYEVNLSYFNTFFTGTEFYVKPAPIQPNGAFKQNGNSNYFYIDAYKQSTDTSEYPYIIQTVGEGVYSWKGRNQVYTSKCGDPADHTKFTYIGGSNNTDKATNLVRGIFGPYIGLESNRSSRIELLNIRIPDYNEASMLSYVDIRARDASLFLAISDRFSWDDIELNEGKYETIGIYRGDCFINNFSHRMIRNFNDPNAPINDIIVDEKTWKDNYVWDSDEDLAKINRGDVNAVKIGHWATFKLCSNINLSLRCIDSYNTSEIGLTGKRRGFYPYNARDVSGESKIPESNLHNAGYNISVGTKNYVTLPDMPAIKSIYSGRIMYSDMSVNDAFVNNFRVFKSLNFYDYPLTYGSIVKLILYSGIIICVFEHGVGYIPVKEKSIASNLNNGNIYINSDTVISEPTIISDSIGSQWAESVIKTESGIYGVDTSAKKIWRVALEGSLNPQLKLKTISDFKVLSFLNLNISLTDKDTNTVIGIRNVKTHYNAFKKDIMFTFYDDLNLLEERVWNLCYNESLDSFITFYSWVPSFSANIDNIFFSFDRNTSKNIAKLYCDPSIISLVDDNGNKVVVIDKTNYNNIGKLQLNLDKVSYDINNDGIDATVSVSYKIAKDSYTNEFTINGNILKFIGNVNKLDEEVLFKIPIIATVEIEDKNGVNTYIKQTVDINAVLSIATQGYIDSNENNTYFWKHGLSGNFKTLLPIKPTTWYGKVHPFEIEVLVSDMPLIHKIFTNLELMANKAQPESLHFEITGEVYTFADDKANMFFRLEAIKNLYLYMGSDITYDTLYTKVTPMQRVSPYSLYEDKSTQFPLYYSRVDTVNEIEDFYQAKEGVNRDYLSLSGSEIIYDKINNEYRIATHIKACPFGGIYKQKIDYATYDYLNKAGYTNILEEKGQYYELALYGRRNGNMLYQEDKWNLQIPSIVYRQKNEKWPINDNGTTLPPLNCANTPVPEDTVISELTSIPETLQNLGYSVDNKYIDSESWDVQKETRIRDRYMKVRIRYSGNDLAVLYVIKTIYNISYA